MYLNIGLVLLLLWGVAYVVLLLGFKDNIMDWMKQKSIFCYPFNKTKKVLNRRTFDYETVTETGYIDERDKYLIITPVIVGILCLFFYPFLLGAILGFWVYIEYIKENKKWIAIKKILTE